jgi:hypothetical protein
MQQIPLQSVPSQQVQCLLNGQNCEIAVYMRGTRLYVDLAVNGVSISSAVLAQNLTSLVPTAYLGFTGYLLFTDTLGTTDPQYTGLGSRYQLLYVTSADLATLGIS